MHYTINRYDLNAVKHSTLTQTQALKLLHLSKEELKQLKLKPIVELTLVEAIACRRKTEYLRQYNEDTQWDNRPKDETIMQEILSECQNKFNE
ncbi:hypothetical protein MZM54_03555 [[Brevibacterium] frigoritolerans]|nr:hypothetical protein [Peribacillus frigoritolerans]